jgi:hypothetical protein
MKNRRIKAWVIITISFIFGGACGFVNLIFGGIAALITGNKDIVVTSVFMGTVLGLFGGLFFSLSHHIPVKVVKCPKP